MLLEGTEVAVKLACAGAKQLAILLYTILREQTKTKGKTRLTNMLRSGKELKVLAVVSAISKCRFSAKWNVVFYRAAYRCYKALYTTSLAGLTGKNGE